MLYLLDIGDLSQTSEQSPSMAEMNSFFSRALGAESFHACKFNDFDSIKCESTPYRFKLMHHACSVDIVDNVVHQ